MLYFVYDIGFKSLFILWWHHFWAKRSDKIVLIIEGEGDILFGI